MWQHCITVVKLWSRSNPGPFKFILFIPIPISTLNLVLESMLIFFCYKTSQPNTARALLWWFSISMLYFWVYLRVCVTLEFHLGKKCHIKGQTYYNERVCLVVRTSARRGNHRGQVLETCIVKLGSQWENAHRDIREKPWGWTGVWMNISFSTFKHGLR